ncbi:craniofacial development protein 2-like [Saccostrea cucullata]|uniref:craniofacial development protein 2-like n=1 Tax=Saccostrea cuccullata TaxID=36930 RepID=UPI002ED60CD9
MGAKRGSHLNPAQSIHLRSSDPIELSSLRKPTMNTSRKPNPILPAPGVSWNPVINTEASRSQQRRNEDVATNRNPRGVASENSGRMKAFLRCNETTNIATYNVNTLIDEDKKWELQHCSQLQHIGILGVQEHRIIHSDPIEYTKFDTSTLVTSSGWRNKSQAAQGGVGLLLDRKARKSLLKIVSSKSGRILVAEFDGNPRTTIIVIYAPTNCAEDSVIEEFYTELRNVLQDVPAHNFLAVLGDFNARLGPEHVPHPFHELTNRSGNYLAEILVEFGLLAVNTQFKKRPGKLRTFKCRASNTLRQLDYILVRQKWRNSVHNAEAYNSFSTVKSDHRIVSAKIKLSLRTSKTAQKVKYDWKQFSSNTELQQKYTFAVKNRFQILMDESNSERYEKFVKVNQEAMKVCLPKRAKIKKSLRSLDLRVSEARQKAQEAQRQYESSKTDEDKDLWSVAVNNLYQAY